MEPKTIVYMCPTRHETVTVQLDQGEPALSLPCAAPRCQAWAVQCDPQPEAATAKPTKEWYKPDRREVKRLSPQARHWCEGGGLLLRNVRPQAVES